MIGGCIMPMVDTIKRKRAVKIAESINSIEGVPIPEEAESCFKLWENGKLTDEQLISAMLSVCSKIQK
jgi:hypothetical protein